MLQGVARAEGFSTKVLYGNITFAAAIGEVEYSRLCNAPGDWLLGERIFRTAAFNLPPIGDDLDAFFLDLNHPLSEGDDVTQYMDQLSDMTGETYEASGIRFTRKELLSYSEAAVLWADGIAKELADSPARVIGVSSSFDQTGAALAVLRRVKALAPDKTTVIGGANCEGPMAEGIASIAEGVDVICSGESEEVLVEVLKQAATGFDETPVIRYGTPCQDLDALPICDYTDWYEAIDTHVPELKDVLWVSYETSRGCWWGAKRHCTFCGLNGQGMGFRAKSVDKVITELAALTKRTKRVCMTDNIMPYRYHNDLVPRLAEELPNLHVFYEQKANLSLPQVQGLMKSGIKVIQPGIESLSTPLLDRMRKGVLARQNIALLRYARMVGMGVKWNLLYAFPGDEAGDYAPMTEFLPLLVHLCPPNALTHLSIDRFSPYFEEADAFGITGLAPWDAYKAIFPKHGDLDNLAYHFSASYDSGSQQSPDLMNTLYTQIRTWRTAWEDGGVPALHVAQSGTGFSLFDTRGLGGGTYFVLDKGQAQAVLVGGPLDQVDKSTWAIRNGFAAEVDGWCVPLATSDPDTLLGLKAS